MVTYGSQAGNYQPNTNIPVPVHYGKQSVLYQTIKQNKAFCTGPLSKTKRSVPGH